MKNKTPKEQGFHMPAEWEPHEATWLSWPHNPETWPRKIDLIPDIWVKMIKVLHEHEKVHLNVNDQAMEDKAKALLKKSGITKNVLFHHIQTDDCWMRDCGPIFVTKKEGKRYDIAITDWEFNKWGGKYPPWNLDNEIPRKIAKILNMPACNINMVLEGGSIDVNGYGTLITTESCLLNKNRNPHLGKKEIEIFLKNCLGATNILWLGEGIAGDDTDGHIDDLARFVNKTTVVTAVEEDPRDENYKVLKDNLKRLEGMQDQNGRPLNIETLPMPGPVFHNGQRLPASYLNFYIANGVVLAPVFGHQNDSVALATLQKFFPGRNVIGINATDLVWGLGAFHCLTQQQPRTN